jgi:hypothetical protein
MTVFGMSDANARAEPKRDPSKPYVYFGLTSLPVDRRFDFRRATPEHEWRLHKFGVRLMPELYDSLYPMMTCEQALQTPKKLADDLRAKGFGVANGVCSEAQSYKCERNRIREILQPLT